MCDYSLMGVPNRLAQEGEELVLYEFRTGSKGLTPDISAAGTTQPPSAMRLFLKTLLGQIEKEKTAVCIPPGARLLLQDIPKEVQSSCGVGAAEEVRFTQLSAKPYAYRDAIRFRNGRELLLQRLTTGQRVKVLQLSLTDEPVPSFSQEPEFLPLMRIDFVAPRLFR